MCLPQRRLHRRQLRPAVTRGRPQISTQDSFTTHPGHHHRQHRATGHFRRPRAVNVARERSTSPVSVVNRTSAITVAIGIGPQFLIATGERSSSPVTIVVAQRSAPLAYTIPDRTQRSRSTRSPIALTQRSSPPVTIAWSRDHETPFVAGQRSSSHIKRGSALRITVFDT